MRIAIVAPRYLPHIGGAEAHMSRLAKYLVESGDIVDVLTHETDRRLPREDSVDGVNVRRFTVVTRQDYALAPDLWRYLRSTDGLYDVVHSHSYHSTAALAASCLTRKSPLLFTPYYHGTGHSPVRAQLHRLYRPLGRRLFAHADAVLCLSNAEATLVGEHFPRAASKVRVIPCGVDVDGLQSARRLPVQRPVMLVLGRMEHYKNTQLVISALVHLAPVQLVLVGDGPERSALQNLAARLDVAERVHFLGILPEDEVRSWLATADVVACLSSHEAFGMVVLEALTAGTPVLASEIPAHRELTRFVSGIGLDLVSLPASPSEVAERLQAALAFRPARVICPDAPDWSSVGARIRQLYAELRGGRQVKRPEGQRA